GTVPLTGCGTHDDQVFEDASGSATLDAARARDPFPQIDAAILAERRNRDAGAQVDLLHIIVGGEDQPPVGAVFVLPVIEAPVGRASFHRVRPGRLSGRGIESADGAVFPTDVLDAVTDRGVEAESPLRTARRLERAGLKLCH